MRCLLPFFILAAWGVTAHAQPYSRTIRLFNVQVNEDGSPGDVDFLSPSAPVTVLFDGKLGKVILAVYAELTGDPAVGVAGAEFYIDGLEADDLPPGWTKAVYPAADTYVLGDWSDPHTHRGEIVRRVNITWPVTAPEDPRCLKDAFVYLGRIELQSPVGNPAFPAEVDATVVAGDPPSNAVFECPLLLSCDFPVFTPRCVRGASLCIGRDDVPEPANPFPADQATKVPPHVVLTWEASSSPCCYSLGTPYTKVFFGKEPDPALLLWDYDTQLYSSEPGALALDTTYYWRIEWTHDQGCGSASSPVWSFTTAETVPVEAKSWQKVKELFR